MQEIVKSGENPSEAIPETIKTRKKEDLFARNWVIDQNATRSYRAAGYRCKTDEVAGVEGCKLLKKPRVRKLIDRLLAARASRLEVRADRVLEELQRLAYSDIRNYIKVQDGDAYVDLSAMTAEQSAAIQEITVEEYTEGRGDDKRDVKRTKFKLHGKMAPLELLYQHAVPRVLDSVGRNVGGSTTVIVIDVPRPGRAGIVIDQLPATNGHSSNGHES